MRPTLVSAIVVTYNSLRHISGCLTSLAESTIRPDEIIVVDNNSTDGTADFVRRTFPDVILLDYSDNKGFAEGNNRAFRIASGRFCFLLNPDATVIPDCLQRLLEAMDKDRRIGVAVPKVSLTREPSVIDSAGLKVNRIGYGWDRGFLEWDSGQHDAEAPVVAGSGCAMLLRTSMLKEIGTFDSAYFLYYEDVDLCLRAWLAGFTVQYVPRAVARHDMKVSGRSLYYNEFLDHSHRLRTMFKNLPASMLLTVGARILAFELRSVVAAVRGRRWKSLRLRLKAWAWNGRHLVSSIRLRARIQGRRAVDGRVLSELFTAGWGSPSARAAIPDYAEAYEDTLDPSRPAAEVWFGIDDADRLGLGWYGSEAIDGFRCRWCCGYGIVFLRRPGPGSEATLRIVCRSPRETKVTVILDGNPQGQWLLSPGGWREYALHVKADREVVRLVLVPEVTFIPADAFPRSRDRRALGVAVSRVALESSCAVAATRVENDGSSPSPSPRREFEPGACPTGGSPISRRGNGASPDMRVVWLSHTGDLGGAELCLSESVKALAERGIAITVLLPWPGPLKRRLVSAGARVHVLPYAWWAGHPSPLAHRARQLYDNAAATREVARVIRHIDPELVITNTLTVPVGAWASRLVGIPHVWYIHEFGSADHDLRFHIGEWLSLRMISTLSAAVIVNSQAVHDHLATRISRSRLRLVSYAVEVPRPTPAPARTDTNFSLILVGYKAPGKGQEDAVRAVSSLARRGVPVRLRLVGGEDEHYAACLRVLCRQLGVENLVEFIPFTDDPYSLVASADVALMCSRSEAFGRVTVEAMKLGKPIVGADSGATRELIRDGWNGLLYRPSDADGLADRIELLYRDPALRASIGDRACSWAERRFNLAAHGSALLAVLREVVGPPTTGSAGTPD